jgi:hypothetical protein
MYGCWWNRQHFKLLTDKLKNSVWNDHRGHLSGKGFKRIWFSLYRQRNLFLPFYFGFILLLEFSLFRTYLAIAIATHYMYLNLLVQDGCAVMFCYLLFQTKKMCSTGLCQRSNSSWHGHYAGKWGSAVQCSECCTVEIICCSMDDGPVCILEYCVLCAVCVYVCLFVDM